MKEYLGVCCGRLVRVLSATARLAPILSAIALLTPGRTLAADIPNARQDLVIFDADVSFNLDTGAIDARVSLTIAADNSPTNEIRLLLNRGLSPR